MGRASNRKWNKRALRVFLKEKFQGLHWGLVNHHKMFSALSKLSKGETK